MQKLLGNCKKGSIFVVSAPAGTGKTTLVQKLVDEFPCTVQSLSFTTRQLRSDEINGVHYNFISVDEFEQRIKDGELLEYAKIYGNYYGTSRTWVDERLNLGKHVILVIDTQGAMQLKEKLLGVFIFIEPPSIEELRVRLLKRRTESKEVIDKRLEWAQSEIAAREKYDYNILNDNLDVAYDVLRSIFIAEEHRQAD